MPVFIAKFLLYAFIKPHSTFLKPKKRCMLEWTWTKSAWGTFLAPKPNSNMMIPIEMTGFHSWNCAGQW